MGLTEGQLAEDLTRAMKARDMPRVYVLRGLLSAEPQGRSVDRAHRRSESRSDEATGRGDPNKAAGTVEKPLACAREPTACRRRSRSRIYTLASTRTGNV